MSFETEVELSLTVPQRELRSVRDDIENELGDVEVGVSASGGGGRGAGGGGEDDGGAVGTAARGAEFRILQKTLKAQQASADFDEQRNQILENISQSLGGSDSNRNRRLFRWARQRTRDMDTMVTLLESIAEDLEDGGGGGGGGGGGLAGIGLVSAGSAAASRGAGAAGSAARGAAGAAGGAVSGLGLGGAAALGAPLLGAAGGAAILLATGRNMEAMQQFEEERGRREEMFGDREGQLGPPGGVSDLTPGGGGGPNISQTLIDLATGNIQAPEWANQMVSGQFTAPEWANMLISAQTPTQEQTPTGIPTSQLGPLGNAQRVQIDFETTVESEFGMSPDELRQRIEEVSQEKADELRRELARETGRGVGGTPIP